MELHIVPQNASLIEATYRGTADIDERYQAKEQIARAAVAAGVNRIVINLTEAVLQGYGVADALKVVGKVESLPAFGHVAYVVPPGHSDMVADLLNRTYGPDYFRVYRDREDAVAWLRA